MTATDFTPIAALVGGAIIGLAAVMLIAFYGRIAGVSGIVSRLLPPYTDREFGGRLAFVLGLVAAPLVYIAAVGQAPPLVTETSGITNLVAGLLVGFGSVWGNGCTSGHGVCGLSRLSLRSVVATIVFMTTAAATVFVMRHVV